MGEEHHNDHAVLDWSAKSRNRGVAAGLGSKLLTGGGGLTVCKVARPLVKAETNAANTASRAGISA